MSSPCTRCPAAFLLVGADSHTHAVLCRVDSTTRGQRDAGTGPIAVVRSTTSPAAFFGFCRGNLQRITALDDELGALATAAQRDIADRARASGARPGYVDCPSWRREKANTAAAKMVDQPGQRRVHHAPT